MTELDKLLLQSRQLAERIRVLSEEHQTLRIKYRLLQERKGIGNLSQDRPLEDNSVHRDIRLMARLGPERQQERFWE